MIGTVLGVILYDENQGIFPERTLCDLFDQRYGRVVVVRHLGLDSLDAVDSRAEIAEVVIERPHQHQIRQLTLSNILLELTLPLLGPPIVGILHVIAAKIGVGDGMQRGLRGGELHHALRIGLPRHGNEVRVILRNGVERQIPTKAVIAHLEARLQRCIPAVSRPSFTVRTVRCRDIGGARQQVGIGRCEWVGGLRFL